MPDDQQAAFEVRSYSVKQLSDLYRVVIASAVGVASYKFVDSTQQPLPFNLQNWKLFCVFVFTIVPFYHGAVMHLYLTYVKDGGSSRVKNWAVIIDYYVLLVGAGLFMALATVVGNVRSFHIIFIMTLFADVVWGVMAVLGFAGTNSQKAEMKWAAINIVAVFLLSALYILGPHFNMARPGASFTALSDDETAWIILLIAGARSLLDYALNPGVYWPGPKHAGQ